MASKFCLVKPLADKFKTMLAKGDITPQKLNEMTTKQRRDFFERSFGKENAQNMNLMVERKLMLKNYEKGLVTWAKEVGGIKKDTQQDLFSRIQRIVKNDEEVLSKIQDAENIKEMAKSGEMSFDNLYNMETEEFSKFLKDNFDNPDFAERVLTTMPEGDLEGWFSKVDEMTPKRRQTLLNPASQEAFLGELAESKLGIAVSPDEAAKITKASQEISKTEKRAEELFSRVEEINSELVKLDKGFLKRELKNINKEIEKIKELAETNKATKEDLDKLKELATSKKSKQQEIEFAKNEIGLEKRRVLMEELEQLKKDPKRFEYGAAKVQMESLMNDLQQKSKLGLKDLFSAEGREAMLDTAKKEGYVRSTLGGVQYLGGLSKSLKATLDNSAVFRQGWKTMFTDTKQWIKNTPKTFQDIYKELAGKDAMAATKADLYSRPNSKNGLYRKMKLDIGVTEDAFPVSLPEKVPVLRRFYKASESAYSGFLYRMRADVADKYLDIAVRNGVNINDQQQAEAIGRVINSLTGRGDLGSLERAGKFTNAVFFSLRNLKANYDTLTMHMLQKSTPFAKKRAAVNLAKIVAGTATVIYTADVIAKTFGVDDAVEWDPRSSNFGRLKFNNTRFDVSGGMGSILTLAGRLATLSSKSSMTGNVSELNKGTFGSRTGLDVVEDYFENKLSPSAAVFRNLLKGESFGGDPTSLGKEVKELFVPLPISNTLEHIKDPDSANWVAAMIADGLGVGTSTWGFERVENLDAKKTTKLERLREKLSEQEYEQVKIMYEQKVEAEAEELVNSEEYQNAEPAEQGDMLRDLNSKYQEKLLAENGIWDANQDPVKAKRKYEMGKVKEKYDKLLSQGKASEAKKLLSGLTDDELDAFEYHVRRGLKGEDNSQSLEQITTRLKQLPPPARKVEAKKMIEQSMLTRDNINTLVKENKDIKQALLDTDYSELHNNYKQAKAVATYEEIGGDWDKIEDIKDSNLGNKLEELYTADKHGLDEEEAEMIGAPYKKRAEIMREKIKDMSESEKDRYIRKLEKAGVVPDGITEKGNRSKSELEDRERLLSMID